MTHGAHVFWGASSRAAQQRGTLSDCEFDFERIEHMY
ncbi:MAG: hypothetical protein RLZZ273_1532 [Bacteroidota bacterium]